MTLFSLPTPRIFTLPPSSRFLDELARGLIDATGAKEKPEALADALIFTPNRRTQQELSLALFRALGTSMLAPEIRALGDIEEDDSVAAFGADVLKLDPPLEPAKRRGHLAFLVQQWRSRQDGEPLPPRSLLSAADELGELIDQAGMVGGVDWKKLESLIPETDFAQHWQNAATFLKIVTDYWPAYLDKEGASETQDRRLKAALAVRDRWARSPPDRLIAIAGSTGSGLATRVLMEAVLKLPRGIVVLSGLDTDLTPAARIAVSEAASHPQHTMTQTLKHLGVDPKNVHAWPGSKETPRQRARHRLINEALAPATETSRWNQRLENLASPGSAAELVTSGLEGLSLIETEDETEEALVAALLLRETLETERKTAALITAEVGLARRTAAVLERWGIHLPISSGLPLHRTEPGSLLLLIARWMMDPAEPVQLMALLKHARIRIGDRTPEALHDAVAVLELEALRGPRMDADLARMAERVAKWPEAASLVRDLDAIHSQVANIITPATIDGAKAAEAVGRLAEAQGGGAAIWGGRHGEMAAGFIVQVKDLSDAIGQHERHAFPDFCEAVMQNMTVRAEGVEHPRIAIWGPLEARLLKRDRVIIASLNEGTWPKAAPADAFLNRKMRETLGLPDPDERVGLAAHDFAEMANAPEVILMRARRVDDKPAVASRWLWRLRTLAAAGLGGREQAEAALKPKPSADPLVWAHALRRVDKVKSIDPPNPKPPVAARGLEKFSPSRAVQLIRDPYADYAKRVLRLEPLSRVGEEIDALLRGTAVHAAVDQLEQQENERPLDELIVAELLKAGASPELIELEKPLWVRAGKAYMRWLANRMHHRVDVAREQKAVITLPALLGPSPQGDVELQATADRIEKLKDGTLAVIDFKTGQPKKAKQVQSGLEPQLALEAAIAARKKFGNIGPARTSELIYFRMALSARTADEDNGEPLEFDGKTTMQVAEDALEGLQKLIKQYADPKQGYLSKPRVEFIWSVSDYDRLARRAEWGVEEGEE